MTSVDGAAHLEAVLALPKAELHCHLDGSLRASTLLELSGQQDKTLPVADAVALADWMRVDDARDLNDYLARFDVTLAVMQDAISLERIAAELVIDASRDGVRYLEARFCPSLNTRAGLTNDEVVVAVLRGLSRGERESGTVARLIIVALRSFPMPHALEMAELAVAYKGQGVVAFDLAGAENGFPARLHLAAFDFARKHDMAITVHAGEAFGADSIREALHLCGADRIGHGTRLLEDPSLEEYVVDRRIPLEVCPTSNVQTRVSETFAEHALARYVSIGAVVTLNTDNRMMSGVTLTDEYMRCAQHLGFNLRTLSQLALASFDSAFVDYSTRMLLRQRAELDIARLLGQSPATTQAQ